jgi:deoxyribodipyrimidine photo-lyase
MNAALAANNGSFDTGHRGVITWIKELIWREFFKNILVANPRVCMNKPYKMETETIPWLKNDSHFTAWCDVFPFFI